MPLVGGVHLVPQVWSVLLASRVFEATLEVQVSSARAVRPATRDRRETSDSPAVKVVKVEVGSSALQAHLEVQDSQDFEEAPVSLDPWVPPEQLVFLATLVSPVPQESWDNQECWAPLDSQAVKVPSYSVTPNEL